MPQQKWKCDSCGNNYDTEEEAAHCEKQDKQNHCRHKDAKYSFVMKGEHNYGLQLTCHECEYIETRIINQNDQKELQELYDCLPGEV